MGVRKAMDSVIEASRGNEITYTLGPLIHNPQAIRMLEARNVYVAEEVDDSLRGKTVVTRAHGITRETREKLRSSGAVIVDATCPKVHRSQGIIKKYHAKGYDIVIVGDRGHAEVESLMSFAGNAAAIVENMDEALALPQMDRVCVVAQTTFNRDEYEHIAEAICAKAGEFYIAETVCAATKRRQSDIPHLAQLTEATVVVGGRNSANTNRLAEISRELGQPTYLVEDASELDLEELSQYTEIGVTAGASTPNWVIKQVVDAIEGYNPGMRRNVWGVVRSLMFFLMDGSFVIAGAGAALAFALSRFMGIPYEIDFSLMAFFYLFTLHTFNKYLEINWNQMTPGTHTTRMKRNWRFYMTFAFVSLVLSLMTAWTAGIFAFSLLAVSYLLGGLYSIRVLPKHWRTRFKSLRDIPGSKDIMIASAWTFAVIALPPMTTGINPGLMPLAAGAAFVFTIVFSRATVLAIGGIQSDKLVGMETIPVLIGKRNTLILLYLMNGGLAAGFILFAAVGVYRAKALVFLVPILYMIGCISWFRRGRRFFALTDQMVLDAGFYILGIVSYMFL